MKKIINNSLYSILGAGVPLLILQLVVFPIISRKVGIETNGFIITLVGVLTICAEPLGAALNNSRLISEKEYARENASGNYNTILLGNAVINAIGITAFYLFYVGTFNLTEFVLCAVTSTFILLQRYYIVKFRIELNYKKIMICNFLLAVGYLVGLIIFLRTEQWGWIFVIGNAGGLIYCIWENPLVFESYKKNIFFKRVFSSFSILLIVEFTNSIVNYADRLIIYPLLGNEQVSIYYSATIVSKIIPLVVNPVSGVLLSAFSRLDNFTKKDFFKLLFYSFVICSFGCCICIFISKPILNILYSEWAIQSLDIVIWTSLSSTIFSIVCLIRPAVLKFRSLKWQIVFGIFDVVTYLGITILFLNCMGLKGFCIGTVVFNCLKLLLRIVAFLKK